MALAFAWIRVASSQISEMAQCRKIFRQKGGRTVFGPFCVIIFVTTYMNSASPYAITIHPAVDDSILAPFHPFIRERIKSHANDACEYAVWMEHSLTIFCHPPTNPTPLRFFLWPLADFIATVLLAQRFGSASLNRPFGITPFPPENVPAAENDHKEVDAELAAEFELWLLNQQILRTGRVIIIHEPPLSHIN